MEIYKSWKFTTCKDEETGLNYYDVKDSNGTDWYELMEELDERSAKYVVGTDPNGMVAWFTTGTVSGQHAPYDGGDIIVTDEFPEGERLGFIKWNGEEFEVIPMEQPRTKEAIQADLEKLLAELKGISE